MNSNKLQYFEGIRGIAALIVVFNHLDFTLSLSLDTKVYELIYQSTNIHILARSIQSIVSFFINGNLAVYTFFFMSGYVISIKLFSEQRKSYLISAISKRYFRLMPPILGSVLIGYLLMHFDLIYSIKLSQILGTEENLGYFYNFYPSFLSAFKSGVWNVLFTKNLGGYNGPLWTMRPEFYGSLFCFLLFILFNRMKARYYIHLLTFILSFMIGAPWLSSFILGFFICDLNHSTEKLNNLLQPIREGIFNTLLKTTFFLLLIIILADITGFNQLQYANTITSSILVLTIMQSKAFQKALELKPILFLGKISFSIYLIHWPIICSFGSYIYLSSSLERNSNIALTTLLTLGSIFFTAYIYTTLVDKQSINIANKIGKLISNTILSKR